MKDVTLLLKLLQWKAGRGSKVDDICPALTCFFPLIND